MPKTVTMDITQNTPPIVYTDQNGANAQTLYVVTGDVVCWQAHTSRTHHHLRVTFNGATPFVDNNNHPVWGFQGSEADEDDCINTGIGHTAHIASNLSPNSNYKYSVEVWDDDSPKHRFDDPIIKYGGDSAVDHLNAATGELNRAVELDSALKERIDALEKQLDQIIRGLSK
jgi:hypothetical protein